jgi:hypothetical protein
MSAGAVRGHAGGAAQDIEDTMTFADLHRIKPMVETMPLATCRPLWTGGRGGGRQHSYAAALTSISLKQHPPHLRTCHRVPSIISGSADTGRSFPLLPLAGTRYLPEHDRSGQQQGRLHAG